MPNVSTNIHKDLTAVELKKIREFDTKLGNIEILNYVQKTEGLSKVVNFVLDGFSIRNLVADPIVWEMFISFIRSLSTLSKEKRKNADIQFWIRDSTQPIPLNIAFSVKDTLTVDEITVELPNMLQSDFEKYLNKEALVWFAFDIETKLWSMKVL